ncbi:MAG: dihydrodipicolinate synthase family protein [Gemmatimonadaceae bacterium]
MNIRQHLLEGQVIPAHPLALTAGLRLDERRQRALTRYYVEAGAGGVAVGVHTTQFAIRDAGLYRPVLELAMEASREWIARSAVEGVSPPFVRVAGVVGDTPQAVGEAAIAQALGYDLALVSLGGLSALDDRALVAHCRAVAEVLPVFGFYLQPAVGGRVLSYAFWRELAEVDRLWAVKVAPFNRYHTLDVVRAMAEAGRDDVALYTGNDDAIVADLVTPVPVRGGSAHGTRHLVGGLLGQWAVWTRRAVGLLARTRSARAAGAVSAALLAEGAALTEANAAIFDAAHGFAGCIPGIHEVLRRQGLLAGNWTLDPEELLSPGQADEIDRVLARYPELTDDAFVAERLEAWMA